MGQINDGIIIALGPGQYNDLLLGYYIANGATSSNLRDAEQEFLIAQGATVANLNDMWDQVLTSLGYSGTLSDKKYVFWVDDGGAVTPGTDIDYDAAWGDTYTDPWGSSYNQPWE